jgi:hypothetical protein
MVLLFEFFSLFVQVYMGIIGWECIIFVQTVEALFFMFLSSDFVCLVN